MGKDESNATIYLVLAITFFVLWFGMGYLLFTPEPIEIPRNLTIDERIVLEIVHARDADLNIWEHDGPIYQVHIDGVEYMVMFDEHSHVIEGRRINYNFLRVEP